MTTATKEVKDQQPEEKKTLLSPEAYKLRERHALIPWTHIHAQFATDRSVENGNPVTREEFELLVENWKDTHPGEPTAYLMTPEAHRQYLEWGGNRWLAEDEIRKLTGKKEGITLQELQKAKEEREAKLGIQNDGEKTTCYRCHKEFQPRSRFVMKDGVVVTHDDGSPKLMGNYVAIPVEGVLTAVAIHSGECRAGLEQIIRRKTGDASFKLRTFPLKETEQFIARKTERQEEDEGLADQFIAAQGRSTRNDRGRDLRGPRQRQR